MTENEIIHSLNDTFILCDIHMERMMYAFEKIKHHFPLTRDNYLHISPDDLSYFDQLIFRYSKLQDTMGKRLFPQILEFLGEDIRTMAFIDLLNKMEKLGLLSNHREWFALRETRNIVTHEYPFTVEDITQGLNALSAQLLTLTSMYNHMKAYFKARSGSIRS